MLEVCMRALRRRRDVREKGFMAAEMILLLLMLVAFLAGVVLLVDRGVSTFDSERGDRGIAEEADRVFEGLEALLGSARVVSLEQQGLDPVFNRNRLVLLAELDGTGPTTGAIEPAENELAVIRQAPGNPGELQVLVGGGTGGAGESELSTMLDAGRTDPFTVEYFAPGGEKIGPSDAGDPLLRVGSVRVRLWLRSGGTAERSSRLIELAEPLPVLP
jgi:hypothetical protein